MPRPQTANTETLDQLFDVLSHPYGRRILTRLHDHNPRNEAEFSPDSLADDVDEADRLNIDLHHHHQPKLAEAGFIDWDRDASIVRRGRPFHEIVPLIELMVNHRDEFPQGWP